MSISAPLHAEEQRRLEALHSLGILDTHPDPAFDSITKRVTEHLRVPISTVSIIDKDREWFKSCQGLSSQEGPRDIAFCSWALIADSVFVVEDTLKDDRFKDNPYVIGAPHIRFYAGVALYDRKSNLPIGVLCAKDIKPRKMTIEEISVLLELAKEAEDLINGSH